LSGALAVSHRPGFFVGWLALAGPRFSRTDEEKQEISKINVAFDGFSA
jgi:hypothetical protein